MTVSQPLYTHYIRNKNYQRVERLDTWSNFQIINRFNKVGTWNLEIPKSSAMATFVDKDSGIIVQRNGVTIFSGQISTDYIVTKDMIKMSGTCDNVLLNSVARPVPSQNTGPYTEEYYVATGQASSLLLDLVNRNIGGLAPSDWKILQLNLATDPHLGSVVTVRARFDPLITLLQELSSTAMATGLGFKILQQDNLDSFVTFQIYQPVDRHLETVFSLDLHTMQDFEHRHQNPPANYFIVALGDDFGENRTILEDGDATSIAEVGRRIPAFVDMRGTTDLGEGNQKLAELLASVVTTDIITIVPTAVPSMIYGVNYDLGDYVTSVVDGVQYPMLVREVAISFDPLRGPLIIPTIADPNGSNDTVEAQHLATLEGRISNIERNYNVPPNSITGDMLHETMRTNIGDVKLTARAAAQIGWLFCDGSAISRSTYSQLFSQIGTLFGVGNGTTTFNIPNFENKFPIGAGDLYNVGATGGASSYNIASHTHSHSHGLNNHVHASQAHTHPLEHSHGMSDVVNHKHDTVITHTHPAGETGYRENDSGGALRFNEPNVSSGAEDHQHNTPELTYTATVRSGTPVDKSGTGSTDPDSNVGAAVYTGTASVPVPNSSEIDNSAGPSVVSQSVLNPYVAVNYMIYTGVP